MDIIPSPEIINLAIVEVQPIDRNPAGVYLAALANDRARRVQRQALDTIAGILTGNPDCLACPWAELRYSHTAAIRARLAEAYKAATANRMLSALRGTLKAAFLLDQIDARDYQKAIEVKSVTGSTVPAGRELQPGEISALMAACENDPGPAGSRDAAMIAVMYAAGLRREEVINLDLESYELETGALKILGKRNKERIAYLVNGAARAMADWLAIRGAEPGPLFLPVNKGGRIGAGRMTTQAVYNMLAKRAAEASVKDFSPHDMRRTFVSDLLDAGADIATVAKMAGHSSVATTARYDRRPEEAKKKAAGLLHVPYHGRLI